MGGVRGRPRGGSPCGQPRKTSTSAVTIAAHWATSVKTLSANPTCSHMLFGRGPIRGPRHSAAIRRRGGRIALRLAASTERACSVRASDDLEAGARRRSRARCRVEDVRAPDLTVGTRPLAPGEGKVLAAPCLREGRGTRSYSWQSERGGGASSAPRRSSSRQATGATEPAGAGVRPPPACCARGRGVAATMLQAVRRCRTGDRLCPPAAPAQLREAAGLPAVAPVGDVGLNQPPPGCEVRRRKPE